MEICKCSVYHLNIVGDASTFYPGKTGFMNLTHTLQVIGKFVGCGCLEGVSNNLRRAKLKYVVILDLINVKIIFVA